MDNNNNNSKNKNKNKTISLEDKKQQKESYKGSSSSDKDKNKINNNITTKGTLTNNTTSKTNTKKPKKVISYGISKKKKKVKTVFFKNKSPLIIILVICILSFISYGIKDNPPSDNNSTEFVSVDPTIEKEDFNSYSTIISDSVKSLLNLPDDQKIVTNTMHRNGLEVIAQGYFYWEEKTKVYFDISLKGNNTISLLINGTEYVK